MEKNYSSSDWIKVTDFPLICTSARQRKEEVRYSLLTSRQRPQTQGYTNRVGQETSLTFHPNIQALFHGKKKTQKYFLTINKAKMFSHC